MTYLEKNEIYLGDTRELIKQIEPNSLDLSVWSPPYFVGKNYEKYLTLSTWKELLYQTIAGHVEALKPGAFMAVNIGDILAFKDENIPRIQAPNKNKLRSKVTKEDVLEVLAKHPDWKRKRIAQELGCSEQTVDRRLNGNNIRGGKYGAQTRVFLVGHMLEDYAYENGLYLYDRRVWVKDPAWRNSQWHSSSYRAVDEFEYIYIFWKPGETEIDRNRLQAGEWAKWGSRAVWSFPSVRSNKEHEAKFPLELPTRLIRLLTPDGGTVLDPFMGSGTTAVACINLDRKFIGFDNQPSYVELARKNVKAAKSQLDLFLRA